MPPHAQKEETAPKENVKTVDRVEKLRNYVRVRPFMASEEKENLKLKVTSARSTVDGNGADHGDVVVLKELEYEGKNAKFLPADPKVKKTYKGFDKMFWSFGEDVEDDKWPYNPHTKVSNKELYDEVKGNLVKNVYDGFNQSVVCYGPINGGKTHTMYGTEEDRGLVPRFLEDVVAAIPEEVKARQAPEEELVITIDVQAVRIYKEEVEDVLNKNKSIQPGSGGNSDDVAAKLVAEDPEQMAKIAAALWGSHGVRSVSSTTTPNKHNRSAVVTRIVVRHQSRIESVGPEKVESTKEAVLTLAELGAGPKAEKETPVEFKKINQASEAFKSLLMKMKEGKGKKNAFLPFGQSVTTKHLAQAIGESHPTMILCVGPHHKATSVNELFLGLGSDLEGCEMKASMSVSEDLKELREQLTKKREEEKQIVRAQGAMEKVKAELERTALELRTQENRKKELEASCENTEDDIAALEKDIARIKEQYAQQREAVRNVLAQYDRRYATAEADRAAAEKAQEGLPEAIAQCEKDLAALQAANKAIESSLNDFTGLEVMFGSQSAAGDLRGEETPEELAEARANLSNAAETVKRQQNAKGLVDKATKRLKDAINMDKETTDLLQKLQKAIAQETEADSKCDDATREIRRAKRRYLKELMEAVEATRKGPLADVTGLTPEDETDIKTEVDKFYWEETDQLALVLLGEEQPDSDGKGVRAPGWCSWEQVEPVSAWLTSHYKKGGDADGTTGGSTEGMNLQFNLDGVTYEGLEATAQLITDTNNWAQRLLNYARNRQAVEDAYAEWLARMPAWPAQANMIQELIRRREEANAEAETLEKEAAKIEEEECKPKEAELEKANQECKQKEAQKQAKNAELKKAVDACNCNIL
eukprot:TRINITY_DN3205_c1_g1_i1.p2 TRINITY_DN3205_c1_g1~~TRINITY_DN3205_c1_g1_i1.p2  ORF type:complete len:876 (+),score=435.59 TRINITY_DN3205_c1_g1_i1:52-2679(+)